MRLIFHAGAHKTGTTTLQRVLHTSRDQLRDQGLYYPDPAPWFGRGFTAHHTVAHAAAEGGRQLRCVQKFLEQVRSAARQNEVVILSTEVPFRQALKGTPGGWWAAHCAYLDRLGAELASFETRIVLVLRQRDMFIESLYHERVSRGYGESFTEFVRKSGSRWLDYDRHVKAFGRVFSVVTTARYADLSSPGLVPGFFDLIGYQAPQVDEQVWERRSADARLTQWMARMNRLDPSEAGIVNRREFSRDVKARDLFADSGQVTLWEDQRLRAQLLTQYRDTPSPDNRPPAPLSPTDEARISEAFNEYLAERRRTDLIRRLRSRLRLWAKRDTPKARRQ
jgi:hypothetical protein